MDVGSLWFGYKYYRSRLGVREQKAYDSLYQGLKAYKSIITLTSLKKEQFSGVLAAVLEDNPMFYHVEGFTIAPGLMSCTVQPIYGMAEDQYKICALQIESRVADFLQGLLVKNGTGWETVGALHTVILRRINYKEIGPAAHSVVGPLIAEQGVCEGIAKTVKLLCDQVGIESMVITGTSLSGAGKRWENHAWNAIKVEGNWHYFDFTYDLTLDQNNPCRQIPRYDYFALSLDEISVDHC